MRIIIQEVCKGHGDNLWGAASRDKYTFSHSFFSMRFGLGMFVVLFSFYTWLNGELLTLKHGSQAVAAQMANNYLLKMAVREKIVSLEKDGQVFPPEVKKFLHESLHLTE